MDNYVRENGTIKKNAGKDIIILLENLKKRTKKRKVYRAGLSAALAISCIFFLSITYYSLYTKIPSVIRIRAGMEQSLYLGVPVKGEVVSISEQGESNIPSGAVTIDLGRPVTLKAGNFNLYQMQVKLFGLLPLKQVNIHVIEDQELIPMGINVGIYVKTDGILVIGVGEFEGEGGVRYSPSKYILKSGDYILKVNGEDIEDKDHLNQRIMESAGEEAILTIRRDQKQMDVKIKPVPDQSGNHKIGIWVRDNAQGVGTMTYIDEKGNFGALGHGINDVDTSMLMDMDDGTLYQTEIVSIKKGASGDPGEMTGMIVYSQYRILGNISSNSTEGIFGKCNEKAIALATEKPIPIGLKQEIQLGDAMILCNVDGSPRYFDIEITAVHLNHDNINRGIELKVTDPELLQITGGIVQGMSGAPIIQNQRFIGAVTHVLVQDSSQGYGIFIENMLAQ